MSLRTYTLRHGQSAGISDLLWDYRDALNAALTDIWAHTAWKKWKIPHKDQHRLYPRYPKDKQYRRELRDRLMENWRPLGWATHWVDSAINTAYSIMDSWKANYKQGRRDREKPVARRPFARVKQTLCKVEGDPGHEKLRITTKPGIYAYIDLSKRWFTLGDKIGEPVITPDRIHLPIHCPGDSGDEAPRRAIGWDMNQRTIDGWSPGTGWVRINTSKLYTAHVSTFEKRRSIQGKLGNTKRGRKALAKYRKRERNRATDLCRKVAKKMRQLGDRHGLEAIDLHQLIRATGHRKTRRNLHRADWRTIRGMLAERREVVDVDPRQTSETCSRCGCTAKAQDPRRTRIHDCPKCGLAVDRDLNAAINVYLKMEGLSPDPEWWRATVIPSLSLGGFALTGDERNGTDEPERPRHEALTPQILIAP